jgi:hypothetical protein
MKTTAEITDRMTEFRENVSIIKEKIREEMSKKHYKRDDRLLKFLNKEQCIWEFALLQLEWILLDQ